MLEDVLQMPHLPLSGESNVIGVKLIVEANQEKNEVPANGNIVSRTLGKST